MTDTDEALRQIRVIIDDATQGPRAQRDIKRATAFPKIDDILTAVGFPQSEFPEQPTVVRAKRIAGDFGTIV